MKLKVLFAPAADVDHQIRRANSFALILRELAKDRRLLSEFWVAKEEFDIEWFGFAGFLMVGGKRMPPPVVAFLGLPAIELEFVALDIRFVEHTASKKIIALSMREGLVFSSRFAIIRNGEARSFDQACCTLSVRHFLHFTKKEKAPAFASNHFVVSKPILPQQVKSLRPPKGRAGHGKLIAKKVLDPKAHPALFP